METRENAYSWGLGGGDGGRAGVALVEELPHGVDLHEGVRHLRALGLIRRDRLLLMQALIKFNII